MFDRGRKFERGQSPLYLKLPSLAVNIYGFFSMSLAGEGSGVRSGYNFNAKKNTGP
jgi:hypothetical protein